jgi:hypothetical protein
MDDFAVFILTHGRPKRVYTYKTLRRQGYTGRIVILIDEQDSTAEEYRQVFESQVETFSRTEVEGTFDAGDNFPGMRGVIYARNASFDVAERIGVRYFIQLDDDYTQFVYRFDALGNYHYKRISNLDGVMQMMLAYYKMTPFASITMAQGGDFFGGEQGRLAKSIGATRKAMNTFICSTERRFEFFGRINEDVNVYVTSGRRGMLFLMIVGVSIQQIQTQANSGGMTELYLDSGTYIKSFYSVMYSPSCVKIWVMGSGYKRIHHRIDWKATTPYILHERHRLAHSRT